MQKKVVRKDGNYSKGYTTAIREVYQILDDEINEMIHLKSNWQQGIFICKDIKKKIDLL